MEPISLTKPQVIAELTRSPHGDLVAYDAVGLRAAADDPGFFAHLAAWNGRHGHVRDAKIALPVIALRTTHDPELRENALALLAAMPPRGFLKALDHARRAHAPDRPLRRLVSRYIEEFEAAPSVSRERRTLQHRKALRTIYARHHIKTPFSETYLFGRPDTGILHAVRELRTADAAAAALLIRRWEIPFLVARGAVGDRASDARVLAAMLAVMSPTEIASNVTWLEGRGVSPDLLAEGIAKVAASGANVLKTTKAAQSTENAGTATALRAAQDQQLAHLAGIDGDWLVLGDASPSMGVAIEAAKSIAAVLTALVRGRVDLTFFASTPTSFEVSGKGLEEIRALTRHVRAGGGTSIGCGLVRATDQRLPIGGIAILSDGEENVLPRFADAYAAYVRALGNEPTVYFYLMRGTGEPLRSTCQAAGIDLQVFDLRGKAMDYYSLPNLAQTMRVGRYALLDDILATPLLTLDAVLPRTARATALMEAAD